QLLDAAHRAGSRGELERRDPEVEVEDLLGTGVGIDQQVPAGDSQVQVTRSDVGGDVTRPKVEELDVVRRVHAHQLALVGALPVARLAQHLCGGTGQHALVGYGDAQHLGAFRARGQRQRYRYTSASFRSQASIN